MAARCLLRMMIIFVLTAASVSFAKEPSPTSNSSFNSKSGNFSVEEYQPLWALVQLESKTKDARYPFSRRRGDFARKNLRGLVAKSLDLTDFNFSGADLRGADFSGSILLRTNFLGANLAEAVLTSTRDAGALFNAKTTLPFSRADADRRGWIELSR